LGVRYQLRQFISTERRRNILSEAGAGSASDGSRAVRWSGGGSGREKTHGRGAGHRDGRGAGVRGGAALAGPPPALVRAGPAAPSTLCGTRGSGWAG
jgi:hypothetical protein